MREPCYCLAMASHNQYCWRGLRLQPGDMPLSERKAAKALCWSRDKLRRRMRMLEAQDMVTIQSTPNVGTMLHVVNWPDPDTAELENGPVLSSKADEKHMICYRLARQKA